MIHKFTIPPELTWALKANNLVIFVGAGISYDLKNTNGNRLGGWNNLISQMLDHLKQKNFEVDHISTLIGRYDPIVILDLIERDNKLSKIEIIEFVRGFYDLSDDNNLALHKKIFQISKKVITTNYDTAFERAEHALKRNCAYKGKKYELTKISDSDAPLLFKLHGCCENADTMVLFPSDYRDLYENQDLYAEHAILVFRNIILNKTILFLGFGVGDFQINNIFSAIKRIKGQYNQKHFIVTKSIPDSSLDFLSPIIINDYKEIEHLIDILIKEKEKTINPDLSTIQLLEKHRDEANRKILEYEELLSKSKNERLRERELLQREALRHFAKAAELQLDKNFQEAIDEYEISAELNPNYEATFFNLGNSLMSLAKTNNDKNFLVRSLQFFQKAVSLNPKNDSAYYNWGNALYYLGKLENSEERYKESISKFKEAIKLKPTFDQHNNCGVAYYQLGKLNKDSDLYENSFDEFQSALNLNPESEEGYNNWGIALSSLAKLKNDEELFKASFKKYESSIRINQNHPSSYNNWGSALLDLADLKNDTSYYEESFEKFKMAVRLGGTSFNLACLYALKRDKKNALEYLETCLKKMEVNIDTILTDEDWKYYLSDEDFKKLIHKYALHE